MLQKSVTQSRKHILISLVYILYKSCAAVVTHSWNLSFKLKHITVCVSFLSDWNASWSYSIWLKKKKKLHKERWHLSLERQPSSFLCSGSKWDMAASTLSHRGSEISFSWRRKLQRHLRPTSHCALYVVPVRLSNWIQIYHEHLRGATKHCTKLSAPANAMRVPGNYGLIEQRTKHEDGGWPRRWVRHDRHLRPHL